MERKLSLLGLDYGEATVGVAASDGLFLTAQPLEVIRRNRGKQLRETFRRIEEIARERGANAIIIGYPKHLNNTVGDRASASEEFAADIARRTGLKVILWNERYTTVSAHRAPFVMVAAEPELGDVAEFVVVRNHLGDQMAVVVDDGELFSAFVVKLPGGIALEHEIVVDEGHILNGF